MKTPETVALRRKRDGLLMHPLVESGDSWDALIRRADVANWLRGLMIETSSDEVNVRTMLACAADALETGGSE